MGLLARGGQQSVRQQAGGQLANPRPLYATGIVHHDAIAEDGSIVHHHQRFEQGLLMEWVIDDSPGPWALQRTGQPFDSFPSELPGPSQAEAVRIRIGDELLALPPLDDIASPRWDELPDIPDATARLKFELTGSPVGNLALDIRYLNGKRPMCEIINEWDDLSDGDLAYGAPEMHIVMTWRNYLRMRSGEVTALEGIEEGGTTDARWTHLLMLHGLLQEREYMDVYGSLPLIPAELGWWGEIAPFVSPPTEDDE
ncbi:MAG: hypothetical protein KDB26_05370 [Microthrixaceae bacterium]|nr:hypothetical protein [Microthrixaceae bacterium]